MKGSCLEIIPPVTTESMTLNVRNMEENDDQISVFRNALPLEQEGSLRRCIENN